MHDRESYTRLRRIVLIGVVVTAASWATAQDVGDLPLRTAGAKAKFAWSGRTGAARHAFKVKGQVGSFSSWSDFDPDTTAFELSAAGVPLARWDPGAPGETSRWRTGRKIKFTRRGANGSRVVVVLDPRKGSLKAKVRRGNLTELRDAGPADVTLALSMGDGVWSQSVTFTSSSNRTPEVWRFRQIGGTGTGGGPGGGGGGGGDPGGIANPPGPVPFQHMTGSAQSMSAVRFTGVARNEAELDVLEARFQPGFDAQQGLEVQQLPRIDWEKDMVIALFAGPVKRTDNGGGEARANSITVLNGRVRVEWTSTEWFFVGTSIPNPGAPDEFGFRISPVQFVRVDRRDGPVDFVVRETTLQGFLR